MTRKQTSNEGMDEKDGEDHGFHDAILDGINPAAERRHKLASAWAYVAAGNPVEDVFRLYGISPDEVKLGGCTD
jgi:hypothetical protein